VRSFALTVLDLLHFGTIRWVARYLRVNWDTWSKRPLDPNCLFSIGKFPFTRSDTSELTSSVSGKGKEDIIPFLRKLARKGKRLEAVAMDMSSAY
jgi:hypothetical protein